MLYGSETSKVEDIRKIHRSGNENVEMDGRSEFNNKKTTTGILRLFFPTIVGVSLLLPHDIALYFVWSSASSLINPLTLMSLSTAFTHVILGLPTPLTFYNHLHTSPYPVILILAHMLGIQW